MSGLQEKKKLGSARNVKVPIGIKKKDKMPYGYCQCGCGGLSPISTTTNKSKGYKKGHPHRFIVGHSMRIRKPGPSMPGWKGGISKHNLYYIWHNMMDRCYNEKCQSYYLYGGRGIKVYVEWHEAKKFIKWGKINGWRKNLEIDRVNNNKGYFPDNCRFATRAQNAKNTRLSKRWYVNGKKYLSLRSAAKKLNLSTFTVWRWCDGGMQHGRYYPPQNNCWSEKLYN